MQTEELVNEIQKGLLRWYDFKKDSVVLYIGKQQEALAEMLTELSLYVVCAGSEQTCDKNWQRDYPDGFDYIISVEDLEKEVAPEKPLRHTVLLR